jgi:SAM-dependent methyltransferase
MFVDVVDLREFYASRLGRMVAASLDESISAIWPASPGERVAGLGYCIPWLDRYLEQSERVVALMPSAQGAVEWPHGGPSLTALVFDEQLPLLDSSVDRLLMVHLLEHCENPGATLAEAWRVLSPGGKLLIAVPNRRGLWARFEHTPFGAGRPFSRGQLARLLRDSLLTPTVWADALHYPPLRGRRTIRAKRPLEWLGRHLWPAFSGLVMVEATKRLYQGLPVTSRVRHRALIPILVPQPNARTARAAEHPSGRQSFL